jgi:hypothetical protein
MEEALAAIRATEVGAMTTDLCFGAFLVIGFLGCLRREAA